MLHTFPLVEISSLCDCSLCCVLKDLSYSQSLGSKLLLAVYKGIAPGEERKALPSMDVSSRRLADGLVQLAFSLGGQVGNT